MRNSINCFLSNRSYYRFIGSTLIIFCLLTGKGFAQTGTYASNQQIAKDTSILSVIPFERRGDCTIMIPVSLGDTKVMAQIDTGSFYTLFPKRMNIRTKGKTKKNNFYDCLDTPVKVEEVTLPAIRIGDFKIENVAAAQTLAPASAERDKNPGVFSFLDRVILANNVFKDVILTIDYADCSVTLRKATFDMSKESLRPGTIFLPFSYKRNGSEDGYDWPVVPCMIDGVTMATCIDTGHLSHEILLYKKGSEKLTRKDYPQSTSRLVRAGSETAEVVTVDRIDRVSFQFKDSPDRSYTTAAIFSPTSFTNDAVIGYELLKNYRVTFDYPRKRLILEPNPLKSCMITVNDNIKVKVLAGSVFKTEGETKITAGGATTSIPGGSLLTINADGSLLVRSLNATADWEQLRASDPLPLPKFASGPGYYWIWVPTIGYVGLSEKAPDVFSDHFLWR